MGKKFDRKAKYKTLATEFKVHKDEDGMVRIRGIANANIADRVNERLNPHGLKRDNFDKNPVLLLMHGYDPEIGGLPIGSVTSLGSKDSGVEFEAVLSNSENSKVSLVRDLISENHLRAVSVGFDPVGKVKQGEGGECLIDQWEIVELSVVGIPMNQASLFTQAKQYRSASLKGSWVAGTIHTRLFEMQRDGKTREEIIQSIMDIADVPEDQINEILSGEVTPIPEVVLGAVSEVMGIELEELEERNAADVQATDMPKEEAEEPEEEPKEEAEEETARVEVEKGESDHGHIAMVDADGNGRTVELDGDASIEYHEHDIIEGVVQEADRHTHPDVVIEEEAEEVEEVEEAEEDEEEVMTAEEKEAELDKSFQECVTKKIPKLLAEGMDSDQAVAVAISMCSAEKAYTKRPSKSMYKHFFFVADGAKAPVQDAEERADSPVTNQASEDTATQPLHDLIKQTNVLLGQLVAETQKSNAILTEKFMAQEPKVEEQVVEEEETEDSEIDENNKALDAIEKKVEDIRQRAKKICAV